jgi:hypothetical protein
MSKMNGWSQQCDFCPNETGGQYRYVYPVPAEHEDPLHPRRAGKIACMQCSPRIAKLQIEEGLVTPTAGIFAEVADG